MIRNARRDPTGEWQSPATEPSGSVSLEMAPRAKSKWKLAVRLGVLLLLLLLVARVVDVGKVLGLFAGIPIWVIALGLLLGLLRLALVSLRWGILDTAAMTTPAGAPAAPVAPPRLGPWDYVRYQLVNSTFNLFMPSVIGGDVARAFLVAAETASHRTRRVLVILFDRVLGILSVAILGTVAGIVAPGLEHRGSYLAGVLTLDALLLLAIAFGAWPRPRSALQRLLSRAGAGGRWLAERMEELGGCFEAFGRRLGSVLAAFLVCLLVHGTTFLLVDLGAGALGIDVPFSTLVLVTTISWVIVLVPVSIGGLGLRELTFVALLAPQGVGEEAAVALSLFQFAVGVLVGLLGIPFVLLGRRPRVSEAEV